MGRFLRFAPLVILGSAGILWLVVYALGWVQDYVVYVRFSLGYALVIFLTILGGGWAAWQWLDNRIKQRAADHLSAIESAAADRRRRFLRRLDHELKNPLTTLQLDNAALETLPAESPDFQASAVRVRAQVSRLVELSGQLRKLADLEVVPLEQVSLDLGALLEDLVNDARQRPQGAARQISLSLAALPWRLPFVMGDADLLYLAFENFLNNAIKFTSPGGVIEIRASEDGNTLTVAIADNGPGIPAAELPQVWDELYRGSGAAGLPGSGLGLPLARTIIQRHGGTVSLRSRPGVGTLVTVTLPARV